MATSNLSWTLLTEGIELLGSDAAVVSDVGRSRVHQSYVNWSYDLAVGASASLGPSDNPRGIVGAVVDELFSRREMHGVETVSSVPWAYLNLPPLVARRQQASPDALALVILSVCEVLRPSIPFYYAALPGAAAVRFQKDDYDVTMLLAPNEPVEEWTPRRLRERYGITEAPN